MSPPALTYGAAGVQHLGPEVGLRVYDILQKHGVKNIDTARIYPGSEKLLGEQGVPGRFSITTKFAGFRPGCNKRENILKSAEESVAELKVQKVDIWLLHSPDPAATSIADTMEAVQELYKQGRFEKFGISNFSVEQVKEIYDYAKSKGYILPTVYQANYNLVARRAESDLFPLLRSLNISIQAYSPIAGGFLVKTPEGITNPIEGSRWDPKTQAGGVYQKAYNKPSLLEYLTKFEELSKESGVSKLGLAYRWTMYHSALKGELGDTLIFGLTAEKQAEDTLVEIEKGPLDDKVVKKLDELWKSVENDAPFNNYEVAINS